MPGSSFELSADPAYQPRGRALLIHVDLTGATAPDDSIQGRVRTEPGTGGVDAARFGAAEPVPHTGKEPVTPAGRQQGTSGAPQGASTV